MFYFGPKLVIITDSVLRIVSLFPREMLILNFRPYVFHFAAFSWL